MPFYQLADSGPIEALTVPFDPSQTQARVLRTRRLMRSRLVSLVITLIILTVLYFWQRDQLAGQGLYTLYGILIGISLAWFLVALVRFLRARRALTRVGSGIALRIGRPGVEVAGAYVPWSEVQRLAVVKGRRGASAVLRLTPAAGAPLEVPLDQMEVRPATLDLTARAYSAGWHGVDLEALDA